MSKSNKMPEKGLKVVGTPSFEISPEDALETAEMLRAAHTLARMAFGACTMCFDAMRPNLSSTAKKKDAKDLHNVFEGFMGIIRNTHEYYARIYASRPKSDVEDNVNVS